jgi:hypothetical protein
MSSQGAPINAIEKASFLKLPKKASWRINAQDAFKNEI